MVFNKLHSLTTAHCRKIIDMKIAFRAVSNTVTLYLFHLIPGNMTWGSDTNAVEIGKLDILRHV